MAAKTSHAQQRKQPQKRLHTAVMLLAVCNVAVLAAIGVLLIVSSFYEPPQQPTESLVVMTPVPTQPQTTQMPVPQGFFEHEGVFADELTAALPQSQPPAMMQEKYKALYAQNPDFIGWITIDGTSIDFPVYQAQDNEKYMRANPYLEYDRRGSIFMDYRCQTGVSRAQFSACTILYGHHLIADDSLFAEVENYLSVAYYKTHPVVRFNTLYGDYEWFVSDVFLTNVDEKDDNGSAFYYLYTKFTDDAAFAAFTDDIHERSFIRNPAVQIQPEDKLLLLSTCTYRLGEQTDARCVLVCRLRRQNEAAVPDVSAAVQNDNPRLPQIWYDLHENGENPWK